MNIVFQKNILHSLLNKNFEHFFVIFLSIFIFYIIFEQLFELTQFVIKYNSTFDYGKLLKQSCNDEFMEYETSRFHISNNINDIKIQNTANQGRYIIFILVITIIIGLYISFIFSFTVRNALYNEQWFDKLNNFTENTLDQNATLLQKIGTGIFKLIAKLLPFIDLYNFILKNLIKNESGYPTYKNIILLVILILINLCIILSFITMPVYIGLLLNNDINISPFNKDIKVFLPYVFGVGLLIILRLSYILFTYDQQYIVKSDPIKDYFSTNVENIFTSNTVFGYITFFTLLFVYIFMFWIIGNIVHLYKLWKQNNDKKEINSKLDVVTEYFNNIIGVYELDNINDHYSYNNISAVSLILLMVVFVITFLYFIIKTQINMKQMIKCGILAPLIFLVSIYIITQINTKYNESINLYIVDNTDRMYKEYIDTLNRTFNKILKPEHQDNKNKKNIDFVCRNVGNAILLTLYNNIFKDIENITTTGDDVSKSYIDLTPEFQYNKQCDATNFFEFTKQNEYDISYYLKAKSHQKNIFYNFAKCSNINQKVLDTIGLNLQIFTEKEFKLIKSNIIKEIFENNLNKKEDPILYVKYKIIENNDEYRINIDNLKNTIKRQLRFAISNILQFKTYNSEINKPKHLIYYDNEKYLRNENFTGEENIIHVDLSLYEIHNELNQLDNNFDMKITNNIELQEYENIIDKVTNMYMDNIYLYLYATVKYRGYDKNEEEKNRFVDFLSSGIKKVFDKINKTMENLIAEYDDKPLTKYIITNHNNIHSNDIFRKTDFNIIEETLQESTIELLNRKKNIDFVRQYYDNLSNYYSMISKLLVALSTNEYRLFEVLLTKTKSNVSDLKTKVFQEKYNEELIKHVNTIMQHKNHYISNYDIMGKKYDIDETDVLSILLNMIDLCQIILQNIEEKYHGILNNKNENIDKINENINISVDVLKVNMNSMNNDFIAFENIMKLNSHEKLKQYETSVSTSMNFHSKSKKADKMIYLLCISYLVPIFLTNFIYYL